MNGRTRRTLTSLLVASCLAGVIPVPACASPMASAIVPALPRPGAMLLMENGRGTVWDVIYPPGVPTAMHRHGADFVGVELVASRLKITTVDGEVHVSDVAHGDMYMLPKGLTRIEAGLAGYPQPNAILIELKDTPATPSPNPTSASTGFRAKAARVAVDNTRLTIWDASWLAGDVGQPFFQSRDIFLVPIDPGVLAIASDDEPPRTLPVAGGQVVFLRRGGHVRTIRSVGGAVRAAVIELK